MNALNYKLIRESIGTQTEVASRLGLTTVTIHRRETGVSRITPEAAIAIRRLKAEVEREQAHIIAGLRMLQEAHRDGRETVNLQILFEAADIATDGATHEPMTIEEIDELIDRIN